jgi:hypothetical protein
MVRALRLIRGDHGFDFEPTNQLFSFRLFMTFLNLSKNAWQYPKLVHDWFLPESFLIYYPLIALSFDAINSELLTPSLNTLQIET